MALTLSIDIETRSSVNIDCGTYKYTEAPDFTILLLSYAYGDGLTYGPVVTVDLAKTLIPLHIENALTDPSIVKTAFNAFFERTCLAKYLGQYMPPEQWRCTMIKAATLGLPLKLQVLAEKALKLPVLKEAEGKALIKFFSVPHALSKKDCMEVFTAEELVKLFPDLWFTWSETIPTKLCFSDDPKVHKSQDVAWRKECAKYIIGKDIMVYYQPHHDPEKWERYKHYNNTDVVVEIEVLKRISWHNVPKSEQELWNVDQQINELGVSIDMRLVNNALAIYAIYRERLVAEAIELTGLDNPNSRNQIIEWLSKEMPLDSIETLKKDDVTALLKQTGGYENKAVIDRVLTIRQELSKTSIEKYYAMIDYVCADGRAHGLLQFYGANRTGRWAGRGIQFQNLRRIDLKVDKKRGIDDLGLARSVVRDALKDHEGFIEYDINRGQVTINGVPQYFEDAEE